MIRLNESNVTVIIIAKNEGEIIETCLDSIFSQSLKPDEVIVVDGRSTDDTVEKVQKYPAKIIVEDEGQTSPSNARNLGVNNASSEIVLVMGADAELGPDCITNVVKYFEDPNVIVVIPTLDIRVHTRLEKVQKAWFWGSRSRLRTPYGTGSSIQFVKKYVYLKITFDTNFGYGDDSDFRRRMLKVYDPSNIVRAEDVKILVDLPHTFSEVAAQFRWYGRTSLTYYTRYHNIGGLIRLTNVLLPSFFIISLIGIPFFSFGVLISGFLLFLLILRYLIFCVRSNTLYFLNFMIYDFFRSYYYVYGILQGLFIKKVGR